MDKEMSESELPYVVDFWAPWCPYCRRLMPLMEKMSEEYSEHFRVGTVNTDEESDLGDRYGIESIPALLLFVGGEVKSHIISPESIGKIEDWLIGNGVKLP